MQKRCSSCRAGVRRSSWKRRKHASCLHLQLVVVLLLPLAGQKLADLLPSHKEFVTVAPVGVCAVAQPLLSVKCDEHPLSKNSQGSIMQASPSTVCPCVRQCAPSVYAMLTFCGSLITQAPGECQQSNQQATMWLILLPPNVCLICKLACSRQVALIHDALALTTCSMRPRPAAPSSCSLRRHGLNTMKPLP